MHNATIKNFPQLKELRVVLHHINNYGHISKSFSRKSIKRKKNNEFQTHVKHLNNLKSVSKICLKSQELKVSKNYAKVNSKIFCSENKILKLKEAKVILQKIDFGDKSDFIGQNASEDKEIKNSLTVLQNQNIHPFISTELHKNNSESDKKALPSLKGKPGSQVFEKSFAQLLKYEVKLRPLQNDCIPPSILNSIEIPNISMQSTCNKSPSHFSDSTQSTSPYNIIDNYSFDRLSNSTYASDLSIEDKCSDFFNAKYAKIKNLLPYDIEDSKWGKNVSPNFSKMPSIFVSDVSGNKYSDEDQIIDEDDIESDDFQF